MKFGKAIWNSMYSSFVEIVSKKSLFPILCTDEATDEMILKLKEIPKLCKKHFDE